MNVIKKFWLVTDRMGEVTLHVEKPERVYVKDTNTTFLCWHSRQRQFHIRNWEIENVPIECENEPMEVMITIKPI